MTAVRKYALLPRAERSLLFRAASLVGFVRLGLCVLPFPVLDRLLAIHARSSRLSIYSLDRLVWAVRAASRRIPGASCLTQSLALHCLLVRAGHPSRIQIGVAKDDSGKFQAHAWVESRGKTLLNASAEVAHYARLTSWERFAS